MLVLDTSAIVAFTQGSVDVGEPIAEVRDSGGTILVPVVCVVEAARTVDAAMLHLLTEHPACELVPLTGNEWPMAATTTLMLGRLDLATSLMAAASRGGFVLTGEPLAYGALGEDVVISLGA
ncbi:hypothetical protein [Virgisporangium ochraceum]|uniref:hypothetical protein n=1 Tax=Virgisporangium ochraceum TaxID=65505 RepID=UPI0019459B54|nr:hypothetical protein [Virgisporangium ochraceum]